VVSRCNEFGIGKLWENPRKTMENLWKTIGKPWKTMGKWRFEKETW